MGVHSILPISEFVVNEKFQRNASKFAIFYISENPKLHFLLFILEFIDTTFSPISSFSHVLIISWESEKLSLECQNFYFLIRFLDHFKRNHETFWCFSENFSLSHQPHENMRKRCDRAIYLGYENFISWIMFWMPSPLYLNSTSSSHKFCEGRLLNLWT